MKQQSNCGMGTISDIPRVAVSCHMPQWVNCIKEDAYTVERCKNGILSGSPLVNISFLNLLINDQYAMLYTEDIQGISSNRNSVLIFSNKPRDK